MQKEQLLQHLSTEILDIQKFERGLDESLGRHDLTVAHIFTTLQTIANNPFVIEQHAHQVAQLIQKELESYMGLNAAIVLMGSNVSGTSFLRRELVQSYKKGDFDFGAIGVDNKFLSGSNFFRRSKEIIRDYGLKPCYYVNPENFNIPLPQKIEDIEKCFLDLSTYSMMLNPTYPHLLWINNLDLLKSYLKILQPNSLSSEKTKKIIDSVLEDFTVKTSQISFIDSRKFVVSPEHRSRVNNVAQSLSQLLTSVKVSLLADMTTNYIVK